MLAAGLHPAVVTLPPGEDPDTVVREGGKDAIQEYLTQAVDILDRKLQILEERDHFSSIERIRGAVDRLLPTLRAAKDPALRDIYVSKVAEKTGVRRETLEGEMGKGDSAASSRSRSPVVRPGHGGPSVPQLGPERELLLLMVQSRDYIERAAERVGAEDFSDPAYRALFEALVADPGMDRPSPGMDPAAARKLEQLLGASERLPEAGRVFEEAVARIKEAPFTRKADELRDALRRETDPERQRAILEELQGSTYAGGR
jgi:DNA primase